MKVLLLTIIIITTQLYAQYWSNAQGIKHLQEKPKKAQSYFIKAIEKDSSDGRLFYNLGNSYNKNNDLKKAISAYTQALENIPTPYVTATHYNLGTTALKNNQLDLAIKHLKTALKRHPEFKKARHNLELALEKKESATKQTKHNQNTNNNNTKQPETSESEPTPNDPNRSKQNTQSSPMKNTSTISLESLVNKQEKEARQNFINRQKQLNQNQTKEILW